MSELNTFSNFSGLKPNKTKCEIAGIGVLNGVQVAFCGISTPQSAIFGFWDLDTNDNLILNHLLLILKMYIYNARTTGYLNIRHLLIYIKGIKGTDKKLCDSNAKRRKKFNKKWKNVLIN